jgi:hypothetical protein
MADLKARLTQSPRENAEAEAMALWLSGQLVAPQALYHEVGEELTSLRTEFSDSIPQLSTTGFILPKHPSYLSIGVEDWVISSYQKGEYTAWDSLNALYRVDTIEVHDQSWPASDFVALRFEGMLNPDSLAAVYDGLPGFRYVSASGNFGDYPCLYPWKDENGLSFLLRYAWGDCPSGCAYQEFWYFRVMSDHIELLGHYDPRNEQAPDWWDEARQAYCKHRGMPCR